MDKFIVVDVETTVRGTERHNKGSAFIPDNEIVCTAISDRIDYVIPGATYSLQESLPLVGHNIKFDLQHLRKHDSRWWKHAMEAGIWDTMIAEYILTAQVSTMASLDSLAEKYGGTLKTESIRVSKGEYAGKIGSAKELWKMGVQTEHFNTNDLFLYAQGDVANTRLIATEQVKLAEERGMMPLIKAIMASVLAVTEMEWNGLHVDRDRLSEIGQELQAERHSILGELEEIFSKAYPQFPTGQLNLASTKQLSSLLFGGDLEYTDQEQIGFFKTGQRKGEKKYKKVIKSLYVNLVGAEPRQEWMTKNGYYSTADEVLSKLPEDNDFVRLIKRLRWLDKQYSTYIEGLESHIYPDGLIHHSLNQALTVTSRLSSSKPNMQNIPSSRDATIKGYFNSRWGEDGYIIQADYSQLEVVWLAYASGDEAMQQDIINGIDFHCKRLALKLGESYEDVLHKCKVEEIPEYVDMRTKIKSFSFQRSYGAGPNAIAESLGLPIDEVYEIIAVEEAAYPGLEKFYQRVTHEVENSAIHQEPFAYDNGRALRRGYYKSPTGRVYHFNQSLYKGKPSFSPTIIKNYPIQGGATGDLVPMVMAVLNHKLYNRNNFENKALLINQVHDSIMLDIHCDVLDRTCQMVKETMEGAPKFLNSRFNLNFNLPLKVDIEYGPNWKQLTKWSN